VGYADGDADSFPACEDCDDNDAAVNSSAVEVCNSIDDDCDGQVDEGGATGESAWYLDADGDGYGRDSMSVLSCQQPVGYVADSNDCDDLDPGSYPGATEVCDEADNNCDGVVDEGAAAPPTWFADADGDSFGNASVSVVSCLAPFGTVATSGDCDDLDALSFPGGTEVCDGADNNCDGVVDEGVTSTFFADADGDGYGDPGTSVQACFQPGGASSNSLDCDDGSPAAHPGGIEVCDGADNDCDGSVDNGALDASTFFVDADGDGYGDPNTAQTSCNPGVGSVANGNDCDDTPGTGSGTNPAATETCDSTDNDCDGAIDEAAVDAGSWYPDTDGDGYGAAGSASQLACDQPAGTASNDLDCNDLSAAISPVEVEICDGLDNNCNAQVDDGISLGQGPLCPGSTCLEILQGTPTSTDGVYWIDPDNSGAALQARCDMSGGGYTLCASLTKGYVPVDTLYTFPSYAFQDRLNSDQDFSYDTEAPARTNTNWDNSESLNYGQFCRLMGAGVSETSLQAKMYNYRNDGSSMRGANYDAIYNATFSGNLFLNWFTDSNASRSFNQSGGDTLQVDSNANSYGGAYTTPSVRWTNQQGGPSPTNAPPAPYTHSSTPWGTPCTAGSSCCIGCTNGSGFYRALPYGQTTILNDSGHSFWGGIANLPYGWSDCTNNGNCDYHESGYGVWLFWVR